MPINSRRWHINPPLPHSEASRFQYYHPVLAQILYNRGFTEPDAASAFLQSTASPGDGSRMRGMGQAVGLIRQAIKDQKKEPPGAKESMVVYGDFDADGVTSTALLVTVLKALGARVRPYIPDRVDEGYGLNEAAIRKLAAEGARLVITVDCGIRSLYEVEIANQLGLEMIITDHHSVGPEVPAARAVLNPKQAGCKYGEKMLAGVGVAFKLADMLLRTAINQDRITPSVTADDLLDLVAIGTVADLAPLNHAENRLLVVRGLARLRQAKRPGIRALLDVASYAPEKVNAWTIGFVLGPRLNAAGRLSSATLAYELLSTEDNQVAAKLARQLNELNETRQQLTREAQERARALVGLDATTDRLPPLIYAAAPDFRQGIVGLVAGRLTEEFYRPSVVVHRGESESHGSCRSIAEFNITEALDQCADLLIRHGGHAQAAGFAIANENLEPFQAKLCDLAEAGLRGKDLRPHLDIDAEVRLSQLDMPLLEALNSLEPCGQDHPTPILCSRRVRVVESRTVGQDSAHLKLRLSDGAATQDAIAFRFGDLAPALPETIDVAYRLELNEYNGTRRLQLNVQDIHQAL